MGSGKRASMREGPLAALFRGTTEAAAQERERAEVERRAGDAWRAPREPEAPSPQERLRQAFSADLPDDVLAPAGAPLPTHERAPVVAPPPGPCPDRRPSRGRA